MFVCTCDDTLDAMLLDLLFALDDTLHAMLLDLLLHLMTHLMLLIDCETSVAQDEKNNSASLFAEFRTILPSCKQYMSISLQRNLQNPTSRPTLNLEFATCMMPSCHKKCIALWFCCDSLKAVIVNQLHSTASMRRYCVLSS